MEIAHKLDNRYFDWLFQQNVFPRRESTSMSGNGKAGSHLRNYLEVHSLSSDQVFLSKVQWMDFQMFFFLLSNCSIVYFIYL